MLGHRVVVRGPVLACVSSHPDLTGEHGKAEAFFERGPEERR